MSIERLYLDYGSFLYICTIIIKNVEASKVHETDGPVAKLWVLVCVPFIRKDHRSLIREHGKLRRLTYLEGPITDSARETSSLEQTDLRDFGFTAAAQVWQGDTTNIKVAAV